MKKEEREKNKVELTFEDVKVSEEAYGFSIRKGAQLFFYPTLEGALKKVLVLKIKGSGKKDVISLLTVIEEETAKIVQVVKSFNKKEDDYGF